MRFKFITFFLVFLFSTSHLFAKPRCELFYEDIYNKASWEDVSINTVKNHKSIGIKLKKFWTSKSKNKLKLDSGEEISYADWDLTTNKDGYFIVGKITNSAFLNASKAKNNSK